MFGKKEYLGLSIQDNVIRIARLRVKGKTLKIIKLDRFSLVQKLKNEARVHESEAETESGSFDPFEEDADADSIFGLDEDEDSVEDELSEIDFGDLEEESEEEEQDFSMDLVEETEAPQSNELLLYNILSGFDLKKINLGLNVPAGHTIFQIIRETDFNDVKRKDLIRDIEEKLESIYGMPKSEDNYAFEVREDGSLLLGSVDDESVTLRLLDQAREFYSGKLNIQDIVPDEIALVGIVRANYELLPDEMTAVIQIGKESCRVVFMKGEEVWLVSPIINEGTEDKNFLNTVFSKILFQLDTGEVPSLDRILLANNTIGESAVEFFSDNFPDIKVGNILFSSELIDTENVDPASVRGFTTAIGVALSASGVVDQHFPQLSFLPKRIVDRQKIFKLEWHGLIILVLIFLVPITFNYFYQQNVQRIQSLSSDLQQINSEIQRLNPTVENTQNLEQQISELKNRLQLLDELSRNSREWSTKFDILNQGIDQVNNSWISAMRQSDDIVSLQGYTLYRNRIPEIVNIFDEATLLDVSNEEIREQQVYNFSISVDRFAASEDIYSPSQPEEVRSLLQE